MIDSEQIEASQPESSRQGFSASRSSHLSRRLASAVPLTGLGSIITMGVSALSSISVGRSDGPLGYAVFVAANMMIFVSAVLCSFGTPLALAKHIAREEEEGRHEPLRHLITTTLILLVSIALVWGGLLSLLVQFFEERLNVSIGQGFALLVPLILICAVVSDCVQVIYSGLLRPWPVIVITVMGPLAMLLYLLTRRVVGHALPIWGAVATLYITSGLTACACLWRDRLLSRPAPLGDLRPVFKEVLPAATFTYFTILTAWGDRLIAGTQMGAVGLGSYAAAVVILNVALRVPKDVAYLLVSASSRFAAGDLKERARFNRAMIGAFGLFSALMTVVLMLMPLAIVSAIFGPGFHLAAPALLVMTPSLLAAAVSIPFTLSLTGSKKSRFVTYLLVLNLLPRLLLLLFFTRRWSLLGTALATVLSDYLLALCCLIVARRIRINFPVMALVRPYLIGLFAYTVGFTAIMLDVPRLISIALALAVFAPSLWRIGRQGWSILRATTEQWTATERRA